MTPKQFVEWLRRTDVLEIDEKELIQLHQEMEKIHHDHPIYLERCLLKLLLNEVYGHKHTINKREVKLNVRKGTISTVS